MPANFAADQLPSEAEMSEIEVAPSIALNPAWTTPSFGP